MSEQAEKRSAVEPASTLLEAEAPEPANTKRPLTTALGSMFVFGRAIAGLVWIVAFAQMWGEIASSAGLDADESQILFWIVVVCWGVSVPTLFVLAVLIWRGSNIARLLVMFGLTVSIAAAAVGYFASGTEITIHTTLVTLAFDILVLLALSSRDARAWARRPRRSRAGESRNPAASGNPES